MIFAIQEEYIVHFQERLDSCSDALSYFKLDEEIAAFNEEIYNVAVREVALSPTLISMLINVVEVEQFRKVSDTHREVSLRTRNAVVTWSSVIQFIHTHNKAGHLPEISNPFTNIDYLLFNIYGANLIKTSIPRLYERRMKKLVELNKELNCFFSNSNAALKKQLSIIFDMLSDKRKEAPGSVKAIERHSKLIHMEFIKYSSLINNLSIVDVERLIDLILRQYINSLNHNRVSTTSKLDIHRVQVPTFMQQPQAVNVNQREHSEKHFYTIVQQSVLSNPLFYTNLYSGRRNTYLGIDVDFSIENLDKILEEGCIENSKKLWNTLIEYGEQGKNKFLVCKHCSNAALGIESYGDVAMFSPNGSAPIKKCESSLIYHLRNNKWLPNKKGHLVKPADITVGELKDGFVVSNTNLLMKALKIGENRENDHGNDL